MKRKISKILIANRGEIACRIIRSAKKLGIKTVAIYSNADKDAINVSMSDEAYCIGTAPSLDSYLRQDRIINVAKESACQAVHPGYGFLSENAEFAKYCEDSGLIFIGPPSAAIRDMGIKSTSKKIMSEAKVPIIGGYHGEDQSNNILTEEADRIGFPLMIKAIRGGGGKGMRIVRKKIDFLSNLESARRESLSAFGNESVLLERYIDSPRHVEVQIFGDYHGNCVYLFERDCSIQRRHQKVIEEAPAPGLDETTRAHLGCTAVRAAKAVNYVGAGTVEFIFDQSDSMFYFMEMNTRLQVEHVVTEMITGTDLVELQIKIANGEQLPFKQEDIRLNGHAVEARIYAEDPYNGFLPTAGCITYLRSPKTAHDVRIETGVRTGDDISVHYDPMIAKLIVWSETRENAFHKLKLQLSKYHIVGPNTNIEFLSNLCSHPQLLAGNVSTSFIELHREQLLFKKPPPSNILIQAAIGKILFENFEALNASKGTGEYNPWITERGFRVNHFYSRSMILLFDNKEYEIDVTYKNSDLFCARLSKNSEGIELSGKLVASDGKYVLTIHTKDTQWKCEIFFEDQHVHLFTSDSVYSFEMKRFNFEEIGIEEVENDVTISPMPGIVNKIMVAVGDKVSAGDQLVVIMAMKMEYVIKCPKNGLITKVLYNVGDSVQKNARIVEMEYLE